MFGGKSCVNLSILIFYLCNIKYLMNLIFSLNNYIKICDIIILTLEHTWGNGWVGPTPKKMGLKKSIIYSGMENYR